MDYKEIQELIQKVNESGLYSFEVESEGTHIKMSKGPEQVLIGNTTVAKETIEKPLTTSAKAPIVTETTGVQETVKEENLHVIKSPIVGTFYASASPDKPNYVSVGSAVKKGSILCILEAMKLMNEIESDIDGEIVEVLVKTEDMVEYGQPLFKIRAAGK
jgi:acetyl-CoA carboxylase biotin carboxyl carrier protein